MQAELARVLSSGRGVRPPERSGSTPTPGSRGRGTLPLPGPATRARGRGRGQGLGVRGRGRGGADAGRGQGLGRGRGTPARGRGRGRGGVPPVPPAAEGRQPIHTSPRPDRSAPSLPPPDTPVPLTPRDEQPASLAAAAAAGQDELVKASIVQQIGSRLTDEDAGVVGKRVIDSQDGDGNSALYRACEAGRTDLVHWLLTHGATARQPNGTGSTPLAVASRRGRVRCVRLLIHWAAAAVALAKSPITVGKPASFPVPDALDSDASVPVLTELAAGAATATVDLDAADKKGGTALAYASKNGHTECVACLLKAGADAKSPQSPALLSAAKRGHLDVVRMLLEAGADVRARTVDGQDAVRVAKTPEIAALVKEWKKKRAKPKTPRLSKVASVSLPAIPTAAEPAVVHLLPETPRNPPKSAPPVPGSAPPPVPTSEPPPVPIASPPAPTAAVSEPSTPPPSSDTAALPPTPPSPGETPDMEPLQPPAEPVEQASVREPAPPAIDAPAEPPDDDSPVRQPPATRLSPSTVSVTGDDEHSGDAPTDRVPSPPVSLHSELAPPEEPAEDDRASFPALGASSRQDTDTTTSETHASTPASPSAPSPSTISEPTLFSTNVVAAAVASSSDDRFSNRIGLNRSFSDRKSSSSSSPQQPSAPSSKERSSDRIGLNRSVSDRKSSSSSSAQPPLAVAVATDHPSAAVADVVSLGRPAAPRRSQSGDHSGHRRSSSSKRLSSSTSSVAPSIPSHPSPAAGDPGPSEPSPLSTSSGHRESVRALSSFQAQLAAKKKAERQLLRDTRHNLRDSKEKVATSRKAPGMLAQAALSPRAAAGASTPASAVCGSCGEVIRPDENHVAALGRVYHLDHLRCAQCDRSLNDGRLFSRDGKVFCDSACHGHWAAPKSTSDPPSQPGDDHGVDADDRDRRERERRKREKKKKAEKAAKKAAKREKERMKRTADAVALATGSDDGSLAGKQDHADRGGNVWSSGIENVDLEDMVSAAAARSLAEQGESSFGEDEDQEIEALALAAALGSVSSSSKKEKKRKPAAPLISETAASRQLDAWSNQYK